MNFIYELFSNIPRLGPGNMASTEKALSLMRSIPENPRIIDVGCGNGASTMVLAEQTDARICALDNHKPYLDELELTAKENGYADQIITIHSDMKRLPFPNSFFDIIWAEASIYSIGFEYGLESWKRNLKKNGFIACSELSWMIDKPSEEISKFWAEQYPEMNSVQKNLEIIEKQYKLINYFPIPKNAWVDYYTPLEDRIALLEKKHQKNNDLMQIIDSVRKEIRLFYKYHNQFAYVFYIMQNE